MRKSNWIVAAIAAVACGVLLWACLPHLPYPRPRWNACLCTATGRPCDSVAVGVESEIRLHYGRRGDRIGTFPRHSCGRDRVGWAWFKVEAGPDDRVQSIAARRGCRETALRRVPTATMREFGQRGKSE